MLTLDFKLVCVLAILILLIRSFRCFNPYSSINSCLESDHHKTTPGPESGVFKECSPWKAYSCCTSNVSNHLEAAEGMVTLYNFHLNHCREKQEGLSEECHRHFVQDACFYQCEPSLGPWKQKVKRKFATERFFRVPLCLSDCESWFNACLHDYTCVANWPRHMNFTGGRGNRCPTGAECRTFEEVFHNASYFCNQVWDESFVAVPDNEPCMRIWFDGQSGNPNEHTAKEYVKMALSHSASKYHPPRILLLPSILVLRALFI